MGHNGQHAPHVPPLKRFWEPVAPPVPLPIPAPDSTPQTALPELRSVPPLRFAINTHVKSHKNRLRIAIDGDVMRQLAQGLERPRLVVEGDCVNGFKIFCCAHSGYAPDLRNGSYYFQIPLKNVRGRPRPVRSQGVAFEWGEREDGIGPVLLVGRMPDCFVPEGIIDKLPKSQLDPETARKRAFDAAEKRLDREMKAALDTAQAAPTVPKPEPEPEPEPDDDDVVEPEPEPEEVEEPALAAADPAPHSASLAAVSDIRAAIQLVNELLDANGDDIHLLLEDNRLRAQRKVVTVSYVDV